MIIFIILLYYILLYHAHSLHGNGKMEENNVHYYLQTINRDFIDS